MVWFEGFEQQTRHVNGADIALRIGGAAHAPVLLLLHGFPQTHAIWHRVAQRLRDRFRLVMPDLRGYGDSSKPPGLPDHSNYSKRTMALDLVALMSELGHARFGVVGHDRGARVAHRMAMDHPQRISRLCVIDVAPTLDMYDATDMRFASAYYHWFHLIQPAPLPERMIGGDPRFCLHWALGGWGSRGLDGFEPQALAEYERCFCTPEAIHGACEDYRASAGVDLEHDRASRASGEAVACDTLVLTGRRGVVHQLFDAQALWQAQCAGRVVHEVLEAGHFIPEELPEPTAARVLDFFG